MSSCWAAIVCPGRCQADNTAADKAPRKPDGPEVRRSSDDAKALSGADRSASLAGQMGRSPRYSPPRPADDKPSTCARLTSTWWGKIPTAAEARDFLDDPNTDKRARLVESLLDSPAYLTHATESYRSLLLPEADADGQLGAAVGSFEASLRKKVCPRTSATTRSSARY